MTGLLFPLRPLQKNALDVLKSSILAGKRRIVLQLPTGAGKTVVAAHMVAGALAKSNRTAFVVPMIALIDQTFTRFCENGINPGDMGVMQADHPWRRPHAPLQICSIQTIDRRGFPDVKFVIVDECHIKFKAIIRWMKERPDVMFFGLSATPWSAGMGDVWDDLIVPTTLSELINLGWLSKFRVFAATQKPDLRAVKTVAGDFHEGELADVMGAKTIVADVVSTWLEKGEGRPTLCFAVNRAHAGLLHDQFSEAGVGSAYIDGLTPREERQAILERYKRGEVSVICSVRTMTTGLDIPCRCIIDAAPTKSEILHCLDSETEILTTHGWKGIGQVEIGDCAASMSNIGTGQGSWANVTGVVERDMKPSESWVEYSAPRANFRVTDNHRMIYRSAHDKSGNFIVGTAREMQSCKGGAYMPVAVNMDQVGVPLTHHELYFIGMMMSDGTWNLNQASISQSERRPEILERIEICFKGCGIGYTKTKINPPPEFAEIKERFSRWRFDFSMGKPRPHKNRINPPLGKCRIGERIDGEIGILHLMPYLDKDVAPTLFAMSRSQFLVFMQGIHDGDGSKMKSPSVNWTPNTWLVVSARKMFADRMQALAAINGFMCNIRAENGPSRKQPIWMVSVTPQSWRHIGGYSSQARNPRPKIEIKEATNERVWCVETETGTIVTRRKGKVTVMGNCQKLGRGLRNEHGKDDLVILDHGGNCQRLGMPTSIGRTTLRTAATDAKERDKGEAKRSEPLPRECGVCNALLPAKTRVCPTCGSEMRRACDVETVDGELVELGTEPKEKGKGTALDRLRKQGKQAVYSQLLGMQGDKKDGWVAHKFRSVFDVFPRGLDRFKASPTPELSSWLHAERIRWAKSKKSKRVSEEATAEDGKALSDAA